MDPYLSVSSGENILNNKLSNSWNILHARQDDSDQLFSLEVGLNLAGNYWHKSRILEIKRQEQY